MSRSPQAASPALRVPQRFGAKYAIQSMDSAGAAINLIAIRPANQVIYEAVPRVVSWSPQHVRLPCAIPSEPTEFDVSQIQ